MADQNKKGLSLTAMVMGLGAVLFYSVGRAAQSSLLKTEPADK